MTTTRTHRTFAHSVVLAALIAAGAAFAPSIAFAGDCPADQVKADAMQPGATEPKDVTDTVLTSIDLSRKSDSLKGDVFRMRRLVVQPGGVVPWHSHGERPANIYIISGSITEYRSSCAVPIEHRSGEAVAEFGALSHWWKNNGSVAAVLISADIFHQGMNDEGMM